ncbi:hypothetical protein D3C75_1095840 [compost metagenome]
MNGNSALCTMRLPLKVTSASMVRQRSVRNPSTGNTLPAGCLLAPPRAFCWALESAPISGARSLNNNWVDTSLPVSLGLGWLATNARSPWISLSPILPLKPW